MGGREESGIRWKEKLGCGAVSTEVSTSPYGGSETGMALQIAPSRGEGAGFYIPGHWMQPSPQKRVGSSYVLFSAKTK